MLSNRTEQLVVPSSNRNGQYLAPQGQAVPDKQSGPPQAVHSEQYCTAATMIEGSAIDKLKEIIDFGDCYHPQHRLIMETADRLHAEDKPHDQYSVIAELTRMGQLLEAGGAEYVKSLPDTITGIANIEFHAWKVRQAAGSRKLWEHHHREAHRLTAEDISLIEVLEENERDLRHLRDEYTEGPSWPSPIRFDSHVLPSFPINQLPPVIRDYALDVAEVVQVPVDMTAMLALSAFATAGARLCQVYIGGTHTETCNLFVITVMSPGSRKTEAVNRMVFPLREAQVEMEQATKSSRMEAEQQNLMQVKRQAHLRDAAVKAKDVTERQAYLQELGQISEETQDVPAEPRLLIDDATPEQMVTMMQQQGGAIALISDEGGFFGQMAGRYSQNVNLDPVLKAHTGSPIWVDRKGRDREYVPHPTLTLSLSIQPEVLTSLADTPAFRGRGLLGRCAWILPDSLIGTRMYSEERRISASAQHSYQEALRRLLNMPIPRGNEERYPIRLCGAALSKWRVFHDEIELRQADGGDLVGIRDWASKLAGLVARIAGNLHLIEHASELMPWSSPIALETAAAACEIGCYLIPHALAAFGQMQGDSRLALAKRLLRWIEKNDLRQFSGRECHQAHKSTVSLNDLLPGLDVLVERGFLRLKKIAATTGRGRPKSPIYEVSPYLHS